MIEGTIPGPSVKGNYGQVNLNEYTSLLDPQTLDILGSQPPVNSLFPLTFEQLGTDYGTLKVEDCFVTSTL